MRIFAPILKPGECNTGKCVRSTRRIELAASLVQGQCPNNGLTRKFMFEPGLRRRCPEVGLGDIAVYLFEARLNKP
jgi:hypothetical protein